MSERELEIFRLCEQLAKLLGDKEAIADLSYLYGRHPEMFRDMQDVSNVIKEVVKEPDLITKAKTQGALLAIKQLNQKKIGEIAIQNDRGTNVIFHANKKNTSKMNTFMKSVQVLVETPSANAAPTWSDRCADKSNDLPKCNKAPSIPTTIIPQNPQTNQNLTKDSKQIEQIDFIEKFTEFTNKKNTQQNNSQDRETMNNKELEIFELSLTLMEALSGDKEAIADLTKLVSNHPELFKNTEDVSKLIKEVLDSPNLISNNHKAKQNNDLLVAKKSLQETPHKMGDIGIRNDNGTNIIYHALKQDSRQFDRLVRRANKLGLLVGASLSHTSRPAELDADEKSSSANAHSATHSDIIPQTTNQYQSTEDSILQRALELQTKQQKGELENFFTHQEENTNESRSKKGEKQS
ncbi:hypothetical protein CCZ01_09695 [Helicobacter monodelphidis]|uniref:hypothetical protein n=1 Tax=Helicobacter sp. 15-1451 TaxID=2004995 RepID=UPI000DCF30A3|nr:hypothetical protein [Helicobacter sp. 15-1451]RAX56381.1 hypothetical protein CCZ01_09695 [Helicobacter sp. 15-1451]